MTRTIAISFIHEKGICKFCNHDKAVSKPSGAFCTRCGKDINDKPIKPKPMRAKGMPVRKWGRTY